MNKVEAVGIYKNVTPYKFPPLKLAAILHTHPRVCPLFHNVQVFVRSTSSIARKELWPAASCEQLSK